MFWQGLKKPIFALAPLADVTDAAFRRVIAKHGKPDVLWTEFVSADGLYATREKLKMPDEENPLMKDLAFTDAERPIIAQFFSSNPEKMEYAAALAKDLGFDGVDINMGCPDKSIEKQGAGAAHMKDRARALEVIRAAKRGAGLLPVSVKTRIGYNKEEIDTWIPEILREDLAALTVHLRTRKEMSKVPAHWDLLPRIVALRDELAPSILILGNGDAESVEHARSLTEEAGADGWMLGRAIFGNPWLFSLHTPTIQEKLEALVEHAQLFEELLPHKSFAIMKKHFKAYVSGFDGATELRTSLMETENAEEVARVIQSSGYGRGAV
jgi:nifR3 family TIM-barrel protein